MIKIIKSKIPVSSNQNFIGVDGFIPEKSFLNPNQYICHDLTNQSDLQHKFDLVICLEVAEHLQPGTELPGGKNWRLGK